MRSLTRRRFGAVLGAILVGLPGIRAGKAGGAPRTHRVEIRQFKFQPQTLVIAVGDSVEWINGDFAPHTATEISDHIWNSGEMARGDTKVVEFTEPGTHSYYCVFHPMMKGEIKVIG